MVGEEHDVAARQAVEHLVALDLDVVQDREVGDGEADAEAREQPAPQPAAEEGAGDDGLGEGGPAGRRVLGRVRVSRSGSGQAGLLTRFRPESYTRARPPTEEPDASSPPRYRRCSRPRGLRRPRRSAGRRCGAPALRRALPSVARARDRSTAACCCCSRATPRPSPASRSATPTSRRASRSSAIDVVGWKPGEPAVIDASVLGFPAESLASGEGRALPRAGAAAPLRDLPPRGRARGEAADGPRRGAAVEPRARATCCPPRARSPSIPARDETLAVELDQAIPEIKPPTDTRYVKHIRIQSERLTKFWGRPMHLGAVVLLPHGFDEHPEARFPLAVFHGHFPYTSEFREQPPDARPALRVLRALPPRLLQPDPAAARPRALQGLDVARLPALPGGGDPAREPVLRRLLRGELRRTWAPTATRSSTSSSRRSSAASAASGRAGRASCTAARRAAGRRSRCRCSTRTSGTALGGLPRPDRLPGLPDDEHLRGPERLLGRGSVRPRGAARPPQLARPRLGHDPGHRTRPSSCSGRRAARAGSSTSGRRSTRPWARTATRSGSGTSARV